MSWNPRTWTTGELVTATLLNTELRDNLNTLQSPATAHYELNESSDYTTTSTSFVDVDATKLALTLTTKGGDVLIGFYGNIGMPSYQLYFDVTLDGVRLAGNDGLYTVTGTYAAATFCYLQTSVAAGSHTFKLQWKVTGSTATLYAGAGTTNFDVHPQFWVREVS